MRFSPDVIRDDQPSIRKDDVGIKPSRAAPIRIVHLTSGHRAVDARIFSKECCSLARAGYDVSLIVAGGPASSGHGVNVVAVKRRSNRVARILATPIEVIVAGLRQRGLIYHFHDPELLPYGLILRALGRRVIYDVHEDLPRDILIKEWIPSYLRRPASLAASVLEWVAARTLSGIVAATPVIARRFPKDRSVLVQNYPVRSEFTNSNDVPSVQCRGVAYVGAVTCDRCAVELVQAIARVERFPDARLLIAGTAESPSFVEKLTALPGWSRVDYCGHINRAGVHRLLAGARMGIALFYPRQTYIESQPVKLFEYMAAGLPVIAADFPRFREILEGNRCSLCVSPLDVPAIASAIEWILGHPKEADEMGKRGRELVASSYNWEQEEPKLLRLYECIAGMGR